MPRMPEIDFHQIAPRCGDKRQAFEELCCQIAHRFIGEDACFFRLNGAGGDGGVECFAEMPNHAIIGWQAKYVFDVDSLITQASLSLQTAMKINTTLTRYILCFPFDFTGPTGRRGRSGLEKFEEWRKRSENDFNLLGRGLVVEAWGASKLRSLLSDLDLSGGLRLFFFNETVLSRKWFVQHLEQMMANAAPRYTPELNIETELFRWFDSFGQGDSYAKKCEKQVRLCRKAQKTLERALHRCNKERSVPVDPDLDKVDTFQLVGKVKEILDTYEPYIRSKDVKIADLLKITSQIKETINEFGSIEQMLLEDLQARFPDWGENLDSPGFRQFMAELMVSCPSANLDELRKVAEVFQGFYEWISSPEGILGFTAVFLLLGEAGVGKTHGICDIAHRRLQNDQLTCILFGHKFGGEPNPWIRILEILGLPIELGREGLLDTLNAAGELSGHPLLLCIDAINETRTPNYWKNHLGEIVHAISSRQYLKLCISCRTHSSLFCIPDKLQIRTLEYKGFDGAEDYACRQFFEFYELEPPVHPVLQPELKNPLYLRLLCETLKKNGEKCLPTGWKSLSKIIKTFIGQKEKDFANQNAISQGSNIVGCALRAISREIVCARNTEISRSSAVRILRQACPEIGDMAVLDWLISNGLLIEEVWDTDDPLGDESTVRPSFERLGDFLVADALFSEIQTQEALQDATKPGGLLYFLLKDRESVISNESLLGALSIIIPERFKGIEIVDLCIGCDVHPLILSILFDNLPWRSPESFTSSTANLLHDVFEKSFKVMDSVLSIAWQPSLIDAFWLDDLLNQRKMSERDAYWCAYLYYSYESSGIVKRLIDAADTLSLKQIEADVLELWGVLLLWFTAAADRRVADKATRALTRIFSQKPEVITKSMKRFICCDDDAVKERVLLSAYGALIFTRDKATILKVAKFLCSAFQDRGVRFDNALIRDHAQCILNFAEFLEVLPEECSQFLVRKCESLDWPLTLPNEKQIEQWGIVVNFKPNEFFNDFFKYTMDCLRPWMHFMQKSEMGKWILQTVARDLGYIGSNCEFYDQQMLIKYGGGRAKPIWAERIAKKYLWIAMYQLASRLHDNVDRQSDSWEPEYSCSPLVLLEERKLDPTLPLGISREDNNDKPWWFSSCPNLDNDRVYSDFEWLAKDDDLPKMGDLISIGEHEGQKWNLLVSYPNWNLSDENNVFITRMLSIRIESFIIKKEDCDAAFDSLNKRNFLGKWMPDGALLSHGFAGEYPWGIPFNFESDEGHVSRGRSNEIPFFIQPAWNKIIVEWEYDASLRKKFHMMVPSRTFFSPGDLWWDWKGGFGPSNGKSFFQDPSVIEPGPESLLADSNALLDRLNELGLGLIWTLLAEKLIVMDENGKNGSLFRSHSQIARLSEDGSFFIGERVSYDDYDKNTCPLISRKKSKKKITGEKRF